MIHFLRNGKNQTIVECESSNNDLRSGIHVKVYSAELLGFESPDYFIEIINRLYELRGIWWEKVKDKSNLDGFIASEFKCAAETFNYSYITD